MQLQRSDTTTLLRTAIGAVLARTNAPLHANDIVKEPEVAALNIGRADGVLGVAHAYLVKGRGYPMHRVQINGMWAYFDPSRYDASHLDGVESNESEPKVNAANPATFDFEADAFAKEMAEAPRKPISASLAKAHAVRKANAQARREAKAAAAPQVHVEQAPTPVQVPAGVKCITLSVGGVSIKIELG